MEHGFVCMVIPEAGLFCRNNRFVDRYGHAIFADKLTIHESKADAVNHKKRMGRKIEKNFPKEVFHVVVLAVDVVEKKKAK